MNFILRKHTARTPRSDLSVLKIWTRTRLHTMARPAAATEAAVPKPSPTQGRSFSTARPGQLPPALRAGREAGEPLGTSGSRHRWPSHEGSPGVRERTVSDCERIAGHRERSCRTARGPPRGAGGGCDARPRGALWELRQLVQPIPVAPRAERSSGSGSGDGSGAAAARTETSCPCRKSPPWPVCRAGGRGRGGLCRGAVTPGGGGGARGAPWDGRVPVPSPERNRDLVQLVFAVPRVKPEIHPRPTKWWQWGCISMESAMEWPCGAGRSPAGCGAAVPHARTGSVLLAPTEQGRLFEGDCEKHKAKNARTRFLCVSLRDKEPVV